MSTENFIESEHKTSQEFSCLSRKNRERASFPKFSMLPVRFYGTFERLARTWRYYGGEAVFGKTLFCAFSGYPYVELKGSEQIKSKGELQVL